MQKLESYNWLHKAPRVSLWESQKSSSQASRIVVHGSWREQQQATEKRMPPENLQQQQQQMLHVGYDHRRMDVQGFQLCFVCRGQWKQRLKLRKHRMSQELCKRRIPRNRLQREFRIKEWTQKLLKKDMGKRGYHATGEKEELVCKVWEKKPQAGSNEEKCRDSVSPSPSPSISVWVQRLWKAM